jgi:thioredoxin reductase (NADPH)
MSPVSDGPISNAMITHPDAIQDAIVIGAGPAGLTAAIYLGRFRRRCLILENGESRARWIPTSHNIPGFAAGIGGEEFLSHLKEQALRYGAQLRHASVTHISMEDGLFCIRTAQGTYRSHFLLLATGVKDNLPTIEGASEAILRSLMRCCPICDAFEAIDKRIAVIGDGLLGEREAAFLSDYSTEVTLLQVGSPRPGSDLRPAGGGGIERVMIELSDLRLLEDRVVLRSAAGDRSFDVIYLALGCSFQNQLARSLKARYEENGALVVNAHQETTVPRLYAAGDVVRGLNQVVVAAAESAIAATDIHNKLREQK